MKVPSLERFAEALAYKREYAADVFPLVLMRLGITEEELELAANRWSSSIGAALQAANPDELLRFARSYSRVEHRIRTRHPQIGSISPLDGLDGLVAASPIVHATPKLRPIPRAVSATDDQAVSVVVPTYLRPEAPASQPMSSPPPIAAPPVPPHPPSQPAPLSTPKPPPSAPALPIAINMPPVSRAISSTAPLSASIVAQGEEIAKRRQALPFLAGAAALLNKEEVAAPAKDKDPAPKERFATGTMLHDGPMPIPKEVIPFDEAQTQDPELAGFSLERYAEVSLAIATTEDRAFVMSRFSLSEAKWKSISARWGERVMNDPALQKQYGEVVRTLRARRPPSGQ